MKDVYGFNVDVGDYVIYPNEIKRYNFYIWKVHKVTPQKIWTDKFPGAKEPYYNAFTRQMEIRDTQLVGRENVVKATPEQIEVARQRGMLVE